MTDDLYRETILELYRNPKNKKILDDFNAYQKEHNPLCGDEVELFLKFDTENKLRDIGFQGEGCAISQAGISLLTEYIKNKTKEELKTITGEQVLVMLGLKNLNPTRLRCALLGLKTLQKALT
jgi:nitrogen fixation NifU-like protein